MPSKAVLRLAGSTLYRTEYDLAVLFNVSIEAVDWKLRYLNIIDLISVILTVEYLWNNNKLKIDY